MEIDVGCGVHFMAMLGHGLIERSHRVSVIIISPEIKEPEILKASELTCCVYAERTGKRMQDLDRDERQGLEGGIRLANPDILH
jgi:hypothetical protein